MIFQENLTIEEKLAILSDAAKYDVACTSSGVERSGKKGMLGSAAASGICHSFAADGRCISLLKILFTNECIYNCKYCINRCTNDIPRATFTPEEVCRLTIQFYRRNYIEGLFLSSGIVQSPDYTMELICQTLKLLRQQYHFNGYIHCKMIPGTSPELVEEAGWLADRMSVNLELPTSRGLQELAPNKSRKTILTPMRQIQQGMAESRELLGMKGGNQSAYWYTQKRTGRALPGSQLNQAGQLHGSKNNQTAQLHDSQNNQTARLHGGLNNQAAQLHGDQNNRTAQLHGDQNNHAAQLHDNQNNQTAQPHGNLNNQSAPLHGGPNNQTTQPHEYQNNHAAQLYGGQNNQTAQLHGDLGNQAAQPYSGQGNQTAQLHEYQNNHAIQLYGGQDNQTAQLHGDLGNQAAQLYSSQNNQTTQLHEYQNNHAAQPYSGQDNQTAQLHGDLGNQAAPLYSSQDNQTAQLHGSQDDKTTRLHNGLNNQAAQPYNDQDNRTAQLHGDLNNQTARRHGGMNNQATQPSDNRTAQPYSSQSNQTAQLYEYQNNHAAQLYGSQNNQTAQLHGSQDNQTTQLHENLNNHAAQLPPADTPQTALSHLASRDTRRGFVPAGQSTQMIIGATGESDYEILSVTEALYQRFDLKRVFYSAFVNVNQDASLPAINGQPPLRREHRLYQADFLLRFYGFQAEELLSAEKPFFNTWLDPKCDWALRHLELFPVEINSADYNTLLRVPGIGAKSARRIVAARRSGSLDYASLKKIGVVLKRAIYFITCGGRMMYPFMKIEEDYITRNLLDNDQEVMKGFGEDVTYRQLSLFDENAMGGGFM